MALRRILPREKIPAEKKLDTLNQQISNANFVLDSLKKESVLMQGKNHDYQIEIEKLKTEIFDLSDRLSNQRKEIIKLDRQSDDLWVTYEKRKEYPKQLENDILKLEIKKKEEIDKISELKESELKSLNEEKELIGLDLNNKKEELLEVSKEVEDKQQRYNELDEEVHRLTQSSVLDEIILKNKSEVDRLNGLIDAVVEKLKEKTSELYAIDDVIIKKDHLISQKDNDIKELDVKKDEIKKEIDDMKQQKMYLIRKEERLNELIERVRDLYKKAGVEINI